MAKSHKEKEGHEAGDDDSGGFAMKGEFRSGPIAGTAIVTGVTFPSKPLQFAEVDGLAIFEGDIVLGTVDQVKAMTSQVSDRMAGVGPVLESIGITGQRFRWPNATIPYDFEAGFPNPQRITDAIAHWEANTRIRFVLRTAANAAQFPNFVRFSNGGGCSSNVGMQGGMQAVTLGPNCTSGNAIHEIGHTVGLWHEQSREDRDTFVRIEWANIDPSMQHNFDQHIADGDDLGAYDYGSIMHYPPTAFSTNGQPTIVALRPIPPGVVMGQRTALSAGDIAGVHAMYPGPTTIKEVPKDPILDPTAKEAVKDPTADPTIKEVRKDPILDGTFKEIRKDPIFDPTFKEVVRDPGGGGGTIQEVTGPAFPGAGLGQGGFGGATPFVIAGPSQFGGGGAADATTELMAQVQALGEALLQAQAQLAQLAAAHDSLVQAIAAMRGGQV
ncbi:Flavastacin precursor [Aquisphaera giovannonii]|uniref:Flavastacin n=1 Tax=Aquisphaera giovannonii TaxID=406548 RepID=A0A5B9WDU0_9BACT|nr:Dot/Icm T4SS effector Zinc-dependent metalloprotease LegP [Aquisphaera giovannonii]QEH38131.1 Flavastacin precursor [Aquisphaera giovannonii]